MNFRKRLQEGIIIFDGGMGTQIHSFGPTEHNYRGKLGCSEILNLTWGDTIQLIHERYFQSGADVVETNTFGANLIVLSEYGLDKQCQEINIAAVEHAKKARLKFNDGKARFIAGSMGPGTKIVSLGHTDYDTMYHSYYEQALGLIKGGIDLFLIETCQDPLQIKICLHAVYDAQIACQIDLPIGVSVTVERNGSLLVGTELAAVLAILAPFKIDFLGMNCATGPEMMCPFVRQLCQLSNKPILIMPNAGLPKNIDGKMVYSLTKEDFVKYLLQFIKEEGIQMVGGCCGTTPEFIKALSEGIRKELQDYRPISRKINALPSLASLFTAQSMSQEPRPLFIGERANTNGSKQFREYLLKNDWDGVVMVALEQQQGGAHAIDLCVAYTGRNELEDMQQAISRIVRQISLPLVLDSTELNVLESALKMYGGRAIINSINLENGEERADKICQLAKRYGAAVIALAIDEKGMAMDVDRKISVAQRIYDIAIHRHGLQPSDLIFDMLTFTLGSGDTTLSDAGVQTLEAIRQIKRLLPGVYTVLGISNISFGLIPIARDILNSVFLAEAVKAGLDMAIVNTKKILPLYTIDTESRFVSESLIYNRGVGNPLFAFIEHFRNLTPQKVAPIAMHNFSLEEKIENHIIQGMRIGLEPLLKQKLLDMKAADIISQILIPAMKKVGELFASGEMQLPFVLQSAEVMKFAVDDVLKNYMDKSEQTNKASIVLATVRGDVHDIGKNLVDIILTNNGYQVYNLGIKCEIDSIIKKAQEVQADAIGMSGLLVKSTIVMKENLEEMKRRGVNIPVLLGGAALTRSYVQDVCAPLLDAPVVYCADAFDGLKTMKHIKEQTIDDYVEALHLQSKSVKSIHIHKVPEIYAKPTPESVSREINIPIPPFLGSKIVENIDLDTIFSYLTQEVLFRGRWGYRRNNMSREAYQALLETKVKPEFERLINWCKYSNIFTPKVVYGYYACQSHGNDIVLYHPNTKDPWLRLPFPRQKRHPYRCIADFVMPVTSGIMDIIAIQIVTIGSQAQDISQELFTHDRYKDYLLFHGLSVETTEALAEYWHKAIRKELNIEQEDGTTIEDFIMQKYRGSRYSFGYPACPDMEGNIRLFEILEAQRIGINVIESGQMIPEQTTSAFILHHPQAKYFNIG